MRVEGETDGKKFTLIIEPSAAPDAVYWRELMRYSRLVSRSRDLWRRF